VVERGKQRRAVFPPALSRAVEPIAVHLFGFFVKNEEKRPSARHFGGILCGIAQRLRRDAAFEP
jgi:hypothetical protein